MTQAKAPDIRKFPITVGVTGHRDILPEHEKALRDAVRRELEALTERYPNSPFSILSSLAEGSDRLVAEVALALGFALVVPLPLPVVMYEKDFANEASVERFRELLALSSEVVEMPFLPGSDAQSCVDGPKRDQQYALCGAYVIRHTSILIALWDGEKAAGTGGTAEIVAYRLEGVPAWLDERWNPFASKDAGLAVVIKTPRARHRTLLPGAFEVRRLFGPRSSSETELARELRAIDELNAHSADISSESTSASTALAAVERRFETADKVALFAQRMSQDALVKILGLAFFFPILLNQLSYRPSATMFFLCVLFIGLAYALHFREINRHRYQAKHLDYRALAEALRVQFYWSLSGLFARVTPYFLYANEGEGGWMRSAARYAVAGLPSADEPPSDRHAERVKTEWISGQREYFERAFRRQVGRNMMLSSIKFALLLFAGLFKFLPDLLKWLTTAPALRAQWFVLAQGAVLGLIIGAHTWSRVKELSSQRNSLSLLSRAEDAGFWSRPAGLLAMLLIAIGSAEVVIFELYRGDFHHVIPLSHLCNLVALSAASAAAIIHIYGHVQAFSDNARRYGRLMSLFIRGEKLFSAAMLAEDYDMQRKVLFSLGRESLTEAGEWLRLQRSRPIEVPRI